MCQSTEPDPGVALVDVTEPVLEMLLSAALHDADADEVAPPLGTAGGWNTERISWFREYHLAAAAGLDGPAQQKTWAITAGGEIAGSIRLRRLPQAGPAPGQAGQAQVGTLGTGTLETGIWLGRSFRGRGIGVAALRLVRAEAAAAGADLLQAETTAGNAAAQALLRSAGAELTTNGPQVTARFTLS
ncbi:GNAT family N-acetyltransferase [Arthrobacter sp. B3I4]|uniref:GNAT family N-acetyltransferase n=1 Tax=Arthrobacter sp. B3I4 TaxID=3042267 RepID=UPI002786CC63|nr:GNAT family N-acetyltransferase [Arthrobacter sp. B3I4]MDQ0756541.1 ribosomal-protein-alanine N-acetyltransferase [Arthrobacter sp. B3I4]